jgi:ubiquinone/menaquinone biosynthesis C-methylase UbiE
LPERLPIVAYDEIAKFYDRRYSAGPQGVAEILRTCADRVNAGNILEVGCGTGHWLNTLEGKATLCGIDHSYGMLAKAKAKSPTFLLCRGDADQLPFSPSSFDFIYCVHAIHHFRDPKNFIEQSFDLLRPGGILAVIGMDPHLGRDNWYVYDYFPSTRRTDLQRYPPSSALLQLMVNAGFIHCERLVNAYLQLDFAGTDVFHDPVLHKDGASQLSLLADKEFVAGMARISAAIDRAATSGREIIFSAHISLPSLICVVPEAERK